MSDSLIAPSVAEQRPAPFSVQDLVAGSRPRTRHAHWQTFGDRHQLFLPNASRVYTVEYDIVERLEAASRLGDEAVEALLDELGLWLPPVIDDTPVISPSLYALSLAVAQKCNLGCVYCYADAGEFNGPAKSMKQATALQSVDFLLAGHEPGERVNLAFLGGEPLANRPVLRAATEYAARRAGDMGVRVGFSITTNGTLLTRDDAEFFERHGFAVTVSLDGDARTHDRQRPFKNGKASYQRILDRVQPLLEMQQDMQVSVRATVTPGDARLRESLDLFLGMGFHSVGFSPVLRSPTGAGEMSATDFEGLLEGMIECGLEFERRTLRGERYAFANIANALREIHKGSHRPYPCGAGAGYLGVAAEGSLAACHRFVGDTDGAMGTLDMGIDRESQNRWLAARHVHSQSPCGACWARYLCSGGCHHEVIARGRPACDYIRGWLHYAFQAYGRLSRLRPEWFNGLAVDE
ncbi:radical SAM protein [Rhizobium calliandrae]|uniref:Radical SAM protein n=1 Tax=Rhizobium calliandrae TaxID=1312182 RepID=A0ABT7K9F1_9HYPH|nr:radical SAM protein [Rhizobium calliandrae]MDL2405202.1 radical SAM protein [Rhizobium calliandrae]